jgi:hypothetical protein
MRQLAGRGVILLVIALSGCTQTVDQAPPPPATAVPDLRGTWAGTWGGAPVQHVVVEQRELGDYAGVYLGPVQVLGRRRPGVSGVLTSIIAGAPVSANVEGRLGYSNGRLTLLVHATIPSGSQQLTLNRTADDRWSGRGESSFSWGPQGPIEIVRTNTRIE